MVEVKIMAVLEVVDMAVLKFGTEHLRHNNGKIALHCPCAKSRVQKPGYRLRGPRLEMRGGFEMLSLRRIDPTSHVRTT